MRTWRALVALAVSSCVIAGPVEAQAGRAEVEEGNRLYEEGRFGEAHAKYLEALRSAPGTNLIRFNDGNALYMSEDFRRASEAHLAAIEGGDPALAGPAWYNVGNALYRQQQLPQALEAYKQALRMSPGDLDAKHNLERVLKQMEEQEQEPQEGEGDGQDENQDQQEQDQQQGGEQDQEENQDQDQDQESPPEDDEAPEPEPQQAPGQMSPEEAQRLLQAIQEDPSEVNRRPPAAARGRRPRKAW